jgi:hypothetical protein
VSAPRTRIASRISSRPATLVLVTAAHMAALWLIWEVRTPPDREVESLTSVMFFVPDATPEEHSAETAVAHPIIRATPSRQPRPPQAPQWPDTGTAITLPPTPSPGAGVDWSAQLAGAARAELDQEETTRKQLAALTRQYVIEPDPRNPGAAPASTFRWYDAGIHRIDTRGPLPVLHLNDRCALILFVLPACLIGHIETHGDLFEGAAAAHEERIATPRPNDVP